MGIGGQVDTLGFDPSEKGAVPLSPAMTLSQIRKERANMGMLDGLKSLVSPEYYEDETEGQNIKGRNLRIVGEANKISIAKILMFEDASNVAQQFLQGINAILNFESTEKEIVRRALDFLSGVAYAVDGSINKVAQSTYIMTPANIEFLSGSIYDS